MHEYVDILLFVYSLRYYSESFLQENMTLMKVLTDRKYPLWPIFFFFLHIYLHVVIWGQEFSHAPCGESLMAIWVSRFCIMGHKVKFWASWGLCVIRIQRCVFFLFVCSGRLQTLKWSFGRGFGGFIKRTSGLNMSYFLFLFFSPMVNFHVNCFLYV